MQHRENCGSSVPGRVPRRETLNTWEGISGLFLVVEVVFGTLVASVVVGFRGFLVVFVCGFGTMASAQVAAAPPDAGQQQQQQQPRGGPAGRNVMAAPRGPPGPPRNIPVVDREKTCPLLLRVFTKNGAHHTVEDFSVRGKEPKDEVQIYTWRDATLRELTDLVKEVAPTARKRDARLSFAFVYPDRRGRNVIRTVGMTHSTPSARRGDDNRSLAELQFQTGDFLDVAIFS